MHVLFGLCHKIISDNLTEGFKTCKAVAVEQDKF